MDMGILSDDTPQQDDGRAELDSHADTGVAGGNTILLEDTGERVQVSAFSPEHESLDNIPVGTVAGAYDCPETGRRLPPLPTV